MRVARSGLRRSVTETSVHCQSAESEAQACDSDSRGPMSVWCGEGRHNQKPGVVCVTHGASAAQTANGIDSLNDADLSVVARGRRDEEMALRAGGMVGAARRVRTADGTEQKGLRAQPQPEFPRVLMHVWRAERRSRCALTGR